MHQCIELVVKFSKFLFCLCALLSFDELVVGAPMHSSLDSQNFVVEHGRTYVYFNDGVRVCVYVVLIHG